MRVEGRVVEEELGSWRKLGLLAKSQGCHIKGYPRAQCILHLGRTLWPSRPWWFMMDAEPQKNCCHCHREPSRSTQVSQAQGRGTQVYPSVPEWYPWGDQAWLETLGNRWYKATAASRLKWWDFKYSSISQFWDSPPGEGREGHHLEWGCFRAGGSWKRGDVEGAVSYSLEALTTLMGNILETWY